MTHISPAMPLSAPAQRPQRWPASATRFAIALLLVGFIVRVAPWLQNRSLWYDEAAIARNIIDRPVSGLFKPLDFNQAAPVGFLLIEKVTVSIFGTAEQTLRLPSVLWSIALLLMALRFVRRFLDPAAGLLYLAMLVFALPLVSYASELKQYGADATIAMALLYLAWAYLRQPQVRTLTAWGVTAIFAVWLSHPSVFVIAAIGTAVLWHQLKARHLRHFAIQSTFCFLAAGGFLCNYLLFCGSLENNDYLHTYWAGAFLPHNGIVPAITWLCTRFLCLCQLPFGPNGAIFCAILLLCGAIHLYRSNRPHLLLLLGCAAVALVAAIAGRYPFDDRLLMFCLPGMLLVLTIGAQAIATAPVGKLRPAGFVLAAFLLAQPAGRDFQRVFVPWARCDLRPVMQYVEDHAQPGDVIYVTDMTTVAFDYYRPRFRFPRLCDIRTLPLDAASLPTSINAIRSSTRPRLWLITAVIGDIPRELQGQLLRTLDEQGPPQHSFEAPKALARLYVH